MISEKLEVIRDGLKIKGLICREPETTGKHPVIIMSHGFTGNMYSCKGYCEALCKEGFICVLFSFCGGGSKWDTTEVRSDGDSTDMTISSEIADLTAVVNYVEQLEYVDNEKIMFLGESQGGFVSGLTAAKLGEKIYKLIMIFPAICIPDHARRGILGFSKYDPQNMPEQIDIGSTVIGRKLHEDVVKMDPYLELMKYKGPVLIIHGDEDSVVDVSYSIRAKNAYGDEQCSLQIVRNMGHGVNESQREAIIASLRQFVANKREILSFRIIITHSEELPEQEKKIVKVYFSGYCESKLFKGTIIPEGVDSQVYEKDSLKSMTAEYSFVGIDSEGKQCSLHVINRWGEKDWKPVIKTDSDALKWLNGADLTAVLEHGAEGPTVRIFV